MLASAMQQGFKLEFIYLPNSPYSLYLTRGLHTWPWEGCRSSWLSAWGLYLISKECRAFPAGPTASRAAGAVLLSPGPGTASLHAGLLHVAACGAYGKEHVWIPLSEQKPSHLLFIALPAMQAVSLDLGSSSPLSLFAD